MNQEEIFEELQALAAQLKIKIRFEKGDFEGGFCVLKEERIVVVNKKLSPAKKNSVLAQGINEIGLNAVYIKPVLRAIIEDEVAKSRKTRQ